LVQLGVKIFFIKNQNGVHNYSLDIFWFHCIKIFSQLFHTFVGVYQHLNEIIIAFFYSINESSQNLHFAWTFISQLFWTIFNEKFQQYISKNNELRKEIEKVDQALFLMNDKIVLEIEMHIAFQVHETGFQLVSNFRIRNLVLFYSV